MAALLALLVPVGACTSHAQPQPIRASVYMNGDLARIPLSGSAIKPLFWTQPATLDATQQAVALSYRRFRSLALIIGGPRPAGVQFDPLLAQLLTGSLAASYIPALGDAGSRDDLTHDRAWERVVAVTVTGSTAAIRACDHDVLKPYGYPEMDHVILVGTDLGSSWRTPTGPDLSTPADGARCKAWAQALPAT